MAVLMTGTTGPRGRVRQSQTAANCQIANHETGGGPTFARLTPPSRELRRSEPSSKFLKHCIRPFGEGVFQRMFGSFGAGGPRAISVLSHLIRGLAGGVASRQKGGIPVGARGSFRKKSWRSRGRPPRHERHRLVLVATFDGWPSSLNPLPQVGPAHVDTLPCNPHRAHACGGLGNTDERHVIDLGSGSRRVLLSLTTRRRIPRCRPRCLSLQ